MQSLEKCDVCDDDSARDNAYDTAVCCGCKRRVHSFVKANELVQCSVDPGLYRFSDGEEDEEVVLCVRCAAKISRKKQSYTSVVYVGNKTDHLNTQVVALIFFAVFVAISILMGSSIYRRLILPRPSSSVSFSKSSADPIPTPPPSTSISTSTSSTAFVIPPPLITSNPYNVTIQQAKEELKILNLYPPYGRMGLPLSLLMRYYDLVGPAVILDVLEDPRQPFCHTNGQFL